MKKNYSISDLTGFKELCRTELLKVGVKGGCSDSRGKTVDRYGHHIKTSGNSDNSSSITVEKADSGIVQYERTEEQKRDGSIPAGAGNPHPGSIGGN